MKAVVAYINLMDNELKQVLVNIDEKNFKDALMEACKNGLMGDKGATTENLSWIASLPDDEEEIKEIFFDADAHVSVLFIEE